MRVPDAQLRAGHLPADLIPQGVDPRAVVIVQQVPRSYTGPILLTLAASGGIALVVVMIAVTLHIAATGAVAVLSATAGVGITLNTARKR